MGFYHMGRDLSHVSRFYQCPWTSYCAAWLSIRLSLAPGHCSTVSDVCHPNQRHCLSDDLTRTDFKASLMDGEVVFAANPDLNSLTLPQTLSQGLLPGSDAACEEALDKRSLSRWWKSLWVYVIGEEEHNNQYV